MRPPRWHPPVELSMAAQTIITHIRRAKLFVFWLHHRHKLFTDAFQHELTTLYKEKEADHVHRCQGRHRNDVPVSGEWALWRHHRPDELRDCGDLCTLPALYRYRNHG